MLRVISDESGRKANWIAVLAVLALGLIIPHSLKAQGASNDIGNGGRHAIQGRLYVGNGRRSQVSGLKVRLNSSSSGDITLVTDESGSFIFRGLNAGSYTVTIEGGDVYENATEYVFIDDPGSSNIRNTTRMRSVPRIVNVQIYLRPTASSKTAPPQTINAKWASIPKKALEHYERGLILAREGDNPGAEAEFRQSLEIAPSFAPAHAELGRIAQRGGKPDAAIEAWKGAVRHDSSDFGAHLNLAVAYFSLKRYEEAEAHFVGAALLDRSAVTPHYYLGLIYIEKKDLDIARAALERARELAGEKNFPALHKYLGGVYMAKNLNAQAVSSLETYIKQDPKANDAERIQQTILDLKNKRN